MSRISIGFLGNLYYDTRSYNLFRSLKEKGHAVFFHGFDWETDDFQNIKESEIQVTKLYKRRFSLLFYIEFAVRLTVQLIRRRSDVYIASDFYALPFCAMAARLWKAELIYDSREIYTELPAFYNKLFFKELVRLMEGISLKRVKCILTTGEMDSRHLEKIYGIKKTALLRNLPLKQAIRRNYDLSTHFPESGTGKFMIYQGIVVPGRGIETAIQMLRKLPGYRLVLLGDGPFRKEYEKTAETCRVRNRVWFAGKVRQQELLQITASADIGLCLIENLCVNNFYALPNKLFEYVMAGLPVLSTDMPQMKAVVEQYQIGAVVPENDVDAAVAVLQDWDRHPAEFKFLQKNCLTASRELNWGTEFEKVYRSCLMS